MLQSNKFDLFVVVIKRKKKESGFLLNYPDYFIACVCAYVDTHRERERGGIRWKALLSASFFNFLFRQRFQHPIRDLSLTTSEFLFLCRQFHLSLSKYSLCLAIHNYLSLFLFRSLTQRRFLQVRDIVHTNMQYFIDAPNAAFLL